MTNPIDQEDEPSWTLKQAARMLRRHPALLRRWITQGLIPTIQQDGGRREHRLTYEAMKMVEAMPRAKGYKPDAPRQTTVTRQSDGATQTITVPGTAPRE